MPPEIGLLALALAVPAFVLALRTRVELHTGRRAGRFGHPPVLDREDETAAALRALTRTLERIEAGQQDLARRVENLETIVTSDATRQAAPQIPLPPAEPTAAEEADRLAQRLRG
jgi:hypothetical protein